MDLSAARVRGPASCASLQPCQLGNDSLLNMVLYPLLDMLGGAFVNHLKFQEDLG